MAYRFEPTNLPNAMLSSVVLKLSCRIVAKVLWSPSAAGAVLDEILYDKEAESAEGTSFGNGHLSANYSIF